MCPLSSEAALCVWDTAVTTMVTHSSGGDPVLPALSWGWQHSFLLLVGIILVFNVRIGLLSACKPLQSWERSAPQAHPVVLE